MLFIKLIACIALTVPSSILDAAQTLPPLKKAPLQEKNFELEKLFFKNLQLKKIQEIAILLKKHPSLANSECCLYYERKLQHKSFLPPLYYAIEQGLFDIAQLLIEADADIHWKSKTTSIAEVALKRPEMQALFYRCLSLR